jgi:hypothetical protein
VSGLFQGIAVLLGVAVAGLAVTALVEGWRAVRIGGSRLLFNGWDWIVRSDRVPPEARPHMRSALTRWAMAMGCMMLAALAAMAAAATR